MNEININGPATGNFIAGDNNTAGDVTAGPSTQDLRILLADLRTAVAATNSPDPLVLHDLDSLATEVATPTPRPSIAQALWHRAHDSLPHTPAIAEAAAKVDTAMTKAFLT